MLAVVRGGRGKRKTASRMVRNEQTEEPYDSRLAATIARPHGIGEPKGEGRGRNPEFPFDR